MSLTFNPNFEFISTNNSSTANLAASATFTGIADDITDIDVIHVIFFATQNCTILLAQSPDSTNWDITDTFSYSANTGFSTSITAMGKFYRILVTNNGGSATTSFRLQSQYSSGIAATPRSLGQKVAAQSLPVTMASDQPAIIVNHSTTTTSSPSWSKKLVYEDMNATVGGVARGTIFSGGTWGTVYSYTGTGFIGGIILNLESFSDWEVRLTVDSMVIFSILTSDMSGDSIYDVDDVADSNQAFLGLSKGSHDRVIWHPPLTIPLVYNNSVLVEVRRFGVGKKFQAGLIMLSKET
jgi:hypothetical protein